ncbi:hypothetical protein CLU84_3546 [Comamonas sp. 26]|nr:hypothetical protein CLU84_3546 [Comamonas sp. 26]
MTSTPTLPHFVWSLPPEGVLTGFGRFSSWGGPATKTHTSPSSETVLPLAHS